MTGIAEVETQADELANRLAVMIRTSQVQWWGESHQVRVTIAGVMTDPEDDALTLEHRAAEAVSFRRGNCQGAG